MLNIYKMEYNSAFKKKGIMIFEDKSMELNYPQHDNQDPESQTCYAVFISGY